MSHCIRRPLTSIRPALRLSSLVLLLLIAGGVLSNRTTAVADEPDQPEVRPMQLDAATEPVPALRYRLLPPGASLKPGNAAPIYLRLIYEKPAEFLEELHNEMRQWVSEPLDGFPRDEARKRLDSQYYNLGQLHQAALRRDCDWDYTVDAVNPIEVRLPELVTLRAHAAMLGVKARVELLDGNVDEAILALQDGMALARHTSRTPILVNTLVGNAIARLMLDRVEECIVQPGTPNLYWALATLPRPLIDVIPPLEWEMTMVQLIFPDLADLDRPRTPGQWQAIFDSIEAWIDEHQEDLLGLQAPREILARQQRGAVPPAAMRQYLASLPQYSESQVDAMSEPEIAVRCIAAVHRQLCDAEIVWSSLPYRDGAALAADQHPQLQKLKEELEIFPLTTLLVASGVNAKANETSLDRRIALLQTIEALRHHAATHEGALPATLEELELPAPLDPATGAPFEYAVAEGTATLTAPTIPAVPPAFARLFSATYQLTVRDSQ